MCHSSSSRVNELQELISRLTKERSMMEGTVVELESLVEPPPLWPHPSITTSQSRKLDLETAVLMQVIPYAESILDKSKLMDFSQAMKCYQMMSSIMSKYIFVPLHILNILLYSNVNSCLRTFYT